MTSAIATLSALADPVRIEIMDRISSGTHTTSTQLAQVIPITRQAVGKHLKTLETVGLVARRQQGREQLYSIDLRPVHEVVAWLGQRESSWDDALGRLKRHLEG